MWTANNGASGLPQITFIIDFWDVPLRGLAEWEGDVFLFLLESSPSMTGCLHWSLRGLTEAQRREMQELQRRFETQVGLHCTYRAGRRVAEYVALGTEADFYTWREEHPDSFEPAALPIVAHTDFDKYVGDE